jgi:hypothetical protein
MRAALHQRTDDIQEYLLERVPQLLSFETVEALRAQDLGLVGDSEMRVYVIADLSDRLGSSTLIDLAHITAQVCRQLGQQVSVSGLLYLPNTTSPAPAEEAIAYAALKELEYYASHLYNGAGPMDPSTRGHVPFNNGCYLLDDVNEAGYTLRDPGQLVMAASEHLYAMTFQNMADVVREKSKRRYLTATLRGKARSYESFGVAVRYIPRQLLAEWAAARLGADVIRQLLDEESGADASHRVAAFIQEQGLDLETLETTLRKTDVTDRIDRELASLQRVSVAQIELRARDTLHTIRQDHLPVLDLEVREAGPKLQESAKAAVVRQVETTLDNMPIGAIKLLQAFLDRLEEQVQELHKGLNTRVQRHQRELSRSLGTVSETYYALRNVSMGTPPWSIVLPSGVSVLLVPLLYLLLVLVRNFYPQNPAALVVPLLVLAAGILGVLAFVLVRLITQRRKLCEQHIHMVRERAVLESRPAIHQEIAQVYQSTLAAIGQARVELGTLAETLASVGTRLSQQEAARASELVELIRPGPFQSVVDREMADYFYARAVPSLKRVTSALLQKAGPPTKWLSRSLEKNERLSHSIYEQITGAGTENLEASVRRFTVAEALTRREANVGRLIESLIDSAQPLWNFDPRFLRRARTQRLTFVSGDTENPAWSEVADAISQSCPDAISHHTDDSGSLTVLLIHLGVPLFALRRIGQYRNHYAELLWRGRLPVHTTNSLALISDLVPIRRLGASASVLFATGLALGVVHREPDGRYIAPRGRNTTIRLSAQKERSVALMGMDGSTCRAVQRQLDSILAEQGAEAVCARLDEYTTSFPGLADWEVKGILSFSQAHTLPQEPE